MGFTHLHLHTQYSLLDGAIRVKELMKTAKEFGMDAVAMTDHGNMFGAVDFFQSCKKAGLKPIIGCETYMAAGSRHDRTDRKGYHLILLARDLEGYRNLVRLTSIAHTEGFYYHPRIDREVLKQYSKGLIGMTACLGGEIPQAILKGQADKAKELCLEYASMFEPGMFYLELQENGLEEQRKVNDALIALAKELDLPLVATNDCHYLKREDAYAHEVLMCIQTGKTMEDERRMKHDTDEFYFKRPEEMVKAFAHVPEAIANTERIAEMCNVEIPLGETFLPQYETPNGESLDVYLRDVTLEGLEQRFAAMDEKGLSYDEKVYRDRIDLELGVINTMDFPGYFLIVWDFIAYAKAQGVPVGPGRGSGAGSLVAYCLGITDIDPMPYDLLFERFLNPERISMPDFDIDFCMNRRDEVIQYVTEKYGADHVGQIVTFGSLKAKGCVRDVARALALSFAEGDAIAKLVPDVLGITLEQALAQEPRLKEKYDSEEDTKKVIDIAMRLEGLNRHTGMHAAGIVIGEKPLWDYVPVFKGVNGELVTQFAKEEVEQAGLVKFDFLGLRTLTVISEAVRLIRNGHDPNFDLNAIPMDDPAVFQLLSSGDTAGVFQLESSGFQDLMKKLRPDRFEDIIAAVALYRPGPLEGGMVDDFVKRKHGEISVVYPHESLESVLEETYGVIVYQEQVMKIANILAGYSLGGADMLRRAMGKKKVEVMAQERVKFEQGAKERGIDPKLSMSIFDLVEKFAGYGFNKSHSAAYGLISYQTGYLKAHYPVELMAAILTSEKDNTEKVVKYVSTVRGRGIEVRQPDVNLSEEDFSVRDGAIRFGLGAVRGVGSNAVRAIIDAREEGSFGDLFDFCERVDLKRVNKKVVESLVKAGAFDSTGAQRDLLYASIESAMDAGSQAQRERDSGQMNMLDMMGGGVSSRRTLPSPDSLASEDRWNENDRLAYEKEALGFYLTGHPLDRYANELSRFGSATTQSLERQGHRAKIAIAGIVSSLRERQLKSGKGRMAFVQLEDLEGSIEIVCFSSVYMEYEETIKADEPLLFRGSVQIEGEGENVVRKVRAEEVVLLSDVRKERTKRVVISVDAALMEGGEAVDGLKQLLRRHEGDCTVNLRVAVPGAGTALVELDEQWAVTASDELVFDLEDALGANRVVFA